MVHPFIFSVNGIAYRNSGIGCPVLPRVITRILYVMTPKNVLLCFIIVNYLRSLKSHRTEERTIRVIICSKNNALVFPVKKILGLVHNYPNVRLLTSVSARQIRKGAQSLTVPMIFSLGKNDTSVTCIYNISVSIVPLNILIYFSVPERLHKNPPHLIYHINYISKKQKNP